MSFDMNNFSEKQQEDLKGLIDIFMSLKQQQDAQTQSINTTAQDNSAVSSMEEPDYEEPDEEELGDGWGTSEEFYPDESGGSSFVESREFQPSVATASIPQEPEQDDGWSTSSSNGTPVQSESAQGDGWSTSSSTSSSAQNYEEKPKEISNIIPFRKKDYTDQTPVARVDVMEMQNEEKIAFFMEQLSKMQMSAFDKANASIYARKSVVEDCKESARSTRTSMIADCEILYEKNQFTDCAGNSKEYKSAVVPLQLGTRFLDNMSMENRAKNLDLLREELTQAVLQFYGSCHRVTELYVVDDQLIINGVAFTPAIDAIEDLVNQFPLDTYDYIMAGKIAPLFDWGYLLDMVNLRELSIPTYAFANDYIAVDLGHDIFRVPYMFSKFKKLEKLCIEGEVIDRNNPKEESSTHVGRSKKEVIEDGLKRANKFKEFYAGFNWSVYSATDGVQGFFVNCLKDYAKNRGNRGIFRYGLGVVARAGGAVLATGVNAGAHLVGGTLKLIGAAFKEVLSDGE